MPQVRCLRSDDGGARRHGGLVRMLRRIRVLQTGEDGADARHAFWASKLPRPIHKCLNVLYFAP